MELTTVADDLAVVHDGAQVRRYDGLEPDTDYELDGVAFRTLPRPGGERLATFATVNDVHFGETECGIIEGLDLGPVFRVADGEAPYPVTMSAGAIAEIAAVAPDVVVAKGDLTAEGTEAEHQQFRDHYGAAFGDRLVVTRGNHDAKSEGAMPAAPSRRVDLPGVTLAVLDTAVVDHATGDLDAEQLAWLDDVAGSADRPVLVFGHHHVWAPGTPLEDGTFFGIEPSASARLVELVAARPRIEGYFAGHTHRNRVQRTAATGPLPWVEVACVKDFPGAWAEYRVFEGGVLQVVHRVSTPAALAWTEATRHMFGGLYAEYAFGELSERCFAIPRREAR